MTAGANENSKKLFEALLKNANSWDKFVNKCLQDLLSRQELCKAS